MVVVTKRAARGIRGSASPYSRTMVFPSAGATVAAAQRASSGWVQVRQTRGLGAITDSVPPWALWGVAGLAAGGLVGYFLLRKKRRRK